MNEDRVKRLNDYLTVVAEKEMLWGDSDCTSFAVKWLEIALGRKIERPSFSSKDEACALIASSGSLENLWSEVAAINGIFEVYEPQAGDVGIVETYQRGHVGGVFMGQGLFALRVEPAGIRILRPRRATIVKAWSAG